MSEDKTGDVKCPKCKSNDLIFKSEDGKGLKAKCNECGADISVPNTDGIPVVDSN